LVKSVSGSDEEDKVDNENDESDGVGPEREYLAYDSEEDVGGGGDEEGEHC
jgi:hypothetical protein